MSPGLLSVLFTISLRSAHLLESWLSDRAEFQWTGDSRIPWQRVGLPGVGTPGLPSRTP